MANTWHGRFPRENLMIDGVAPAGVPGALGWPPLVNAEGHAAHVEGSPAGQFARSKSPAPGVPPYRPTWIFNPTTLQWMGETDGTVHGKVMGSVVLKRAIVDRPGQVPGGE